MSTQNARPRTRGPYWGRKKRAQIIREAESRWEYNYSDRHLIPARYTNGGLRTAEQIESSIKGLTRAKKEAIRDWTKQYVQNRQQNGGLGMNTNNAILPPHPQGGTAPAFALVPPAGIVQPFTTAVAPTLSYPQFATQQTLMPSPACVYAGATSLVGYTGSGHQQALVSTAVADVLHPNLLSNPASANTLVTFPADSPSLPTLVYAPHPGFLDRPSPMHLPTDYPRTPAALALRDVDFFDGHFGASPSPSFSFDNNQYAGPDILYYDDSDIPESLRPGYVRSYPELP